MMFERVIGTVIFAYVLSIYLLVGGSLSGLNMLYFFQDDVVDRMECAAVDAV